MFPAAGFRLGRGWIATRQTWNRWRDRRRAKRLGPHPVGRNLTEGGADVDADAAAARPAGGDERGTASNERIEH
jgi:hypothetical protein